MASVNLVTIVHTTKDELTFSNEINFLRITNNGDCPVILNGKIKILSGAQLEYKLLSDTFKPSFTVSTTVTGAKVNMLVESMEVSGSGTGLGK